MPLNEDEVRAIAKAVVEEVQQSHHTFWIEPEQHYQDHLAMREVSDTLKTTRSIFFKAFLGLVVLGSIILAAVGMGAGKLFGK